MKHAIRPLLLALTLLTLTVLCAPARAVVTYGTLLSYDFDTTAWTGAATEAVGTIDVAGSATPSLGVRSSSVVTSGPLPISITETNLGKLTLAFSLSASNNKPVTVTIESYDSGKLRTGGLQTLVYPAAPDFYQRYAVDLSTCKPSGAGTFVPNAPFVSFSFSPASGSGAEVRVDNVNYALPAYYVGGTGKSDFNSGRTESTPFATVQKAMGLTQAGDIVVVRNGTYNGSNISSTAQGGTGSVASFPRAGTPAKWIVLKNYPGETPLLWSNAWNIINIATGYNGSPSSVPLAYLEVRGIHIRGQGDLIYNNGQPGGLYPGSIGQVDSRSNSNGISIDGRYMVYHPHHIRIADNFVEYCPGGGFGSGEADWVTFEGNISRNNCWPTIYAPSGISVSGNFNFDATDNVYKRLVRNNVCYGNQTFVPWEAIGKISDGNGIILDVNNGTDQYQGPVTNPDVQYIGRTLVQSNLSFNNGGSGIHSFRANRVDIIGNTTYLNSASPELQYAEISAGYADDVRIINNILVAPIANTAAGEPAEPVNGNGNATNVVYSHNLYFGGNKTPIMGSGDVIGDPKFLNPSRDSTVADFHLLPTSPALEAGITQAYSPFLDLDGRSRNAAAPDKGAYELTTTATAMASSANPSAFGASVTLTATVTGNGPTGTVTFTDGGTTLTNGTVTLVNGTATLTTSALSVGSHSLTASYGSDPGNTPSVSSILAQAVKGAPTAGSQSVTTLINHAVSVTLTGSDPNTPTLTLTYTVTTTPAHGTLSGTAPNLTYTPTAGYSGADSFAFTVNNGFLTSSPATVSVTVTQATVSGTVTLQAWQGTPQPLTFTLTPTGGTGGSVVTQTLTPDTNGAFSLAGVAPGTYTLGIKGSKWLRQSASVDTTGGNATVSTPATPLTLPAGDINNDNQVSGVDAAMLRASYGSSAGGAADLNGDGQVSGIDAALLRANYGKTGTP